MKKLAGLVVILAVLVFGGYYGMGLMTERSIKRSIDNLTQVNGLYAEVTEYQRGWFSSNAMINWKLHVPERVVNKNGQAMTVAAQDYSMQMPLKVYHGPVIMAESGLHFGLGYAETDIQLPAKYSKQFDEMFTPESGKPKLVMSLFVNYLNKSDITVGVPAFKLFAKKGDGKFEWEGMYSTTTMTSNLNDVVGQFKINGFSLSKNQTTVQMGEFDTEYDMHRSASGLMLGKAKMDFPSLLVMNDKTKVFEMQGMSFSSNNDVAGSLFSAYLSASLSKIFANGQTYGPGKLEIAIKNLDADVLAKINEQTAALQNGTEEERQQAVMSLLPELPKLFSRGAQFEISTLNFTLPQGSINGDLSISLPAGENDNPFALAQKVQGHGKLSIPADVLKELMIETLKQQMKKQPALQQALIEKIQASQPDTARASLSPEQIAADRADKQIEQFVQSGLITKQGSNYMVEFKLEQGQLTVNGKPFNPSMVNF